MSGLSSVMRSAGMGDAVSFTEGFFGFDAGREGEAAKTAAAASARYYNMLASTGQDQYDFYKKSVRPIYQAELDRVGDPGFISGERERARGEAGTDFAIGSRDARQTAMADASRYGLSPEDTFRMTRPDLVTSATARAGGVYGAGENARIGALNQRFAAINPGMQMPGQAMNAFSGAGAGQGNLAGYHQGVRQTGLDRFTGAATRFGQALAGGQGQGGAADGGYVNDDAGPGSETTFLDHSRNFGQNLVDSYSAAPAGGDAAADPWGKHRAKYGYTMGRAADGGRIDAPGGPRDDAGEINVSGGEFFFSAPVTAWYGTKHLTQMVKQAEEALGLAPLPGEEENPQAVRQVQARPSPSPMPAGPRRMGMPASPSPRRMAA